MNQQLFRAKSIQKVTSPEQLDAYIRVSTPSVWILLTAIVVLLIGVCVWGILGRLDTTVPAVAVVEDNRITMYVKEADIREIEAGMKVKTEGGEFEITSVDAQPVTVDEAFSEYVCHVGNLQQGEWVFAVTCSGEAGEGVYAVKIVTESVSPMSFVIN